MKSKMKATMTIAMTYGITRRDASRVLERNALQHLSNAHAAIRRALEGVVHLFPLHDLERIGVTGEQIPDGGVVDRVALFLELLDVRDLLADELCFANRGDTALNVLRRLYEDACELACRILDDGDVQHLETARRPVEEIDDVVEPRRKHVNVLTIDRRHEALVDPLIDRECERISLVLDVLDCANVITDVLRIIEQLRQHARRLRQMRRELIEEVEELFVTRNQSPEQAHSGLPVKAAGRYAA